MYFKLTRLWDRFLGGDDCSVDHNSFFVLGQFQGYQLSLTLSYLNFSPILIILKCPPLFSKSLFCCYPTSRLPKCPFSYRSNGEMWVRKWSKKKVTNHFPFPIIFESGKKAFKCGTSRVCHGRVAFLCVYHTTPLTCKLSKLLKIIFLLTVVLVTTAACSNTREP